MSKNLPNQEKSLLKQIAEGDEKAFAQIFHAYKNKLFAFILKLSGSKEIAEDVVQEVFLKIWEKREMLSAIDNFSAFLFRVTQNHAVNLLKRMSREALARRKVKFNHSSLTPDKQLLFNNLQLNLEKIIDALPARQKEIYRLKREQHLKEKEIASQLNISPSTVKNHFTQALNTIRENLLKYYPDLLMVGIFVFVEMRLL